MHRLTPEQTREIVGTASATDVLKSTEVTKGADPTHFVVRKTAPKLIECATLQEARDYEANWPGEVLSEFELLHRISVTPPETPEASAVATAGDHPVAEVIRPLVPPTEAPGAPVPLVQAAPEPPHTA